MQTQTQAPLLSLQDVSKWYAVKSKKMFEGHDYVKAVNGVTVDIQPGETLGIVGESGCGKTTLGRVMIRLLEATSGKVVYDGDDITHYDEKRMRPLRRDMQIIFQDPYSSLDPRMTVGDIIAEPFANQKLYTDVERKDRVNELMEQCGLDPVYVRRYPHEFSGGQRQRIGIARALALTPRFMLCDEPVSALDVSIQSQIINLLMDLQEQTNLTYAFISHNLGVVYHMSRRIMVMYLGYVVELADRNELYYHPAHPYTQALLKSIPNIDFEHGKLEAQIHGDLPSPIDLPPGCAFSTRCPHVRERCREAVPPLREIAPGHQCACFFAGEFD